MVTYTDGTVVSEQWTLPFGNIQPFTSVPGGENPYQHPSLGNPSKKRFTSYDRSEATGLDYAVNRFYCPQLGRFTQVDPIGMRATSLGNPQTLNMYAYCGNDPINHVDPDGLFIGFIIGAIIAIGTAIVGLAKKVAKRVIASARGRFSVPVARIPPTFPGNLPGVPIKLPDIVRTPPFIHGLAALDDVVTWEWSGVGALMRFLQSKGRGKKARKRLCPKGSELAGNSKVIKAMDEAFDDSDYGSPYRAHEEGGYIWRHSKTGDIQISTVPSGPPASSGRMGLPGITGLTTPKNRPGPGYYIVGTFHTHPYNYGDPVPGQPSHIGYDKPELPSDEDIAANERLYVPGLIRYKDEKGVLQRFPLE